MFDAVKSWLLPKKSVAVDDEEMRQSLEKVREHLPKPLFWLFGKTQSGKTSIIKFLTGADQAEIGKGFQPCTKFSRQYQFPTPEAPLIRFLDTRGLDEPGYDPTEDLDRFNNDAHVVIVTVKAMDHAQAHVIENVRRLRRAQPRRPVVLALTCLHEAYPQRQHSEPYPFTSDHEPIPTEPPLPDDLLRSIAEQKHQFAGLFDHWVALDLTPVEEGFAEPNYGGSRLREVLLESLPSALGQTLISLHEVTKDLQDLFSRRALPHIMAYAQMAAAAGAVPVPIVDAVLISGVQSRMVYHLAQLYGQPLTGARFREIASAMGLGLIARQAARHVEIHSRTWDGSRFRRSWSDGRRVDLRARQSVLLLLPIGPLRPCSAGGGFETLLQGTARSRGKSLVSRDGNGRCQDESSIGGLNAK